MSKLILILTLAVVGGTVVGCNNSADSISCGITFRNKTEAKIWVESATGLGGDARCGNLIPGAEAGIGGLTPKKLSATVTIEWWHNNRERPDDENKIFTAKINVDVDLPKNHDLIFTLINDSEWTSSVEPNHNARQY